MNSSLTRLFVAAALLLVAGGAAFYYAWWEPRHRAVPEVPAAASEAASAETPASAPAAVAAVQYPLEAAASAPELPKLGEEQAYVVHALVELLGKREVTSFIQLDGFVRHLVATVDSLPRQHASPSVWPVNPAGGRLMIDKREGASYIAAANAARYAPFVHLAVSINTAKAAALYRRLYPLLQQAYDELGYPGRYFNDRVVEVIDHLLATPEPEEPLKIKLTQVQGPEQPTRPWTMYEFDDPSLEARSAGQKLLLRMGADNERQIKAKLRDFRQQIARGSGAQQH